MKPGCKYVCKKTMTRLDQNSVKIFIEGRIYECEFYAGDQPSNPLTVFLAEHYSNKPFGDGWGRWIMNQDNFLEHFHPEPLGKLTKDEKEGIAFEFAEALGIDL